MLTAEPHAAPEEGSQVGQGSGRTLSRSMPSVVWKSTREPS